MAANDLEKTDRQILHLLQQNAPSISTNGWQTHQFFTCNGILETRGLYGDYYIQNSR